MPYAWTVKPGDKVDLSDYDPDHHDGLEKPDGKDRLAKLADEISELQELLAAAKKTALLCVFQGLDTAGKDGAINRILTYTNVQGCKTHGFKVPTEEEAAHDFLWRVHPHAPAKGEIALFNRSHYEDVVVVRVHDLVPKEVWKQRYDQINAFEALLSSAQTIILKFYLHISKEEQEQRLLDREKDPEKAWKLSVQDWKERDQWDDYRKAYEDALSKCSTNAAPWKIVPANHKWFRDLAIAEAIRDALAPCREVWMRDLQELGRTEKEALQAYRSGARP